ncbi:MAG: 4Fe-4S binding protein [Thermoplasmata archaeon]
MSGRVYYGIPRREIAWLPTVDARRCNGCGVCISFCPNGVYALEKGRAVMRNPYGCEAGCSGCVRKCSEHAISFPSLIQLREALKSLRARHVQG